MSCDKCGDNLEYFERNIDFFGRLFMCSSCGSFFVKSNKGTWMYIKFQHILNLIKISRKILEDSNGEEESFDDFFKNFLEEGGSIIIPIGNVSVFELKKHSILAS